MNFRLSNWLYVIACLERMRLQKNKKQMDKFDRAHIKDLFNSMANLLKYIFYFYRQ